MVVAAVATTADLCLPFEADDVGCAWGAVLVTRADDAGLAVWVEVLGPAPAPLLSSASSDGFFWLAPILHDLEGSFFFVLRFDFSTLGCCCCVDGTLTAAAVAGGEVAAEAAAEDVLALAAGCASL